MGVISANFNWLGKIPYFIALHQMSLSVRLQMSNVPLRCFAGISDFTSFTISGNFGNENTNFCIGCVILPLMARMPGWFSYDNIY